MGSLRAWSGVVIAAALAGCPSSDHTADAGGGTDAGPIDAGTGGPDAGPSGSDAGSCFSFQFVASGQSCGAGCSAVSCTCPGSFPHSIAACTVDGCIVSADCTALCAADPSVYTPCASVHTVLGQDGGTDAGNDGGSTDAGSGCFRTAGTWTAPDLPFWIRVGDLNGDGRIDVAVAGTGFLDVLLNAGGGAFGPASSLDAGGDFQIADMNHDGRLDLVTQGPSGIVTFENLDGGFVPRLALPSVSGRWAIADFDRDGWPDFATLGSSISLQLNQRDGGFGPPIGSSTTFCSTGTMRAGVLTDSGLPDLVISDPTGFHGVCLLINGGDAGFAQTFVSTGDQPNALAIGDLTGEGLRDVAATSASLLAGQTTAVDLFLNSGSGAFAWRQLALTGGTPTDVAVGDLLGTGTAQAVVALYSGLGVFAFDAGQAVEIDPPLTASAVALGDLDGDGWLDLVTADVNARTVSVSLSSCAPVNAQPACVPVGNACDGGVACCDGLSCTSSACL